MVSYAKLTSVPYPLYYKGSADRVSGPLPSVISVLSPQKHGLVIIPDGTTNGDVNHEPMSSGITVVSHEAAQVLESAGEGPLGESEGVMDEPKTGRSDVI